MREIFRTCIWMSTVKAIVTAADIQMTSELEIVNPELYLLLWMILKLQLSIDFTVERGRGYLPSNDRVR